MKKLFSYTILLFLIVSCSDDDDNKSIVLPNKIVTFKDENFKKAVIAQGVDINKDGQIQFEEAKKVTSLNVNKKEIADLTGIEAFINLKTLNCSNNKLTSINLESNTQLTGLNCAFNSLTTLSLDKNVRLINVDCRRNYLTSLKIYKCKSLKRIFCAINQLSSLSENIGDLKELKAINLGGNKLKNVPARIVELKKLISISLAKNEGLKLTEEQCKFITGIKDVLLPQNGCIDVSNIVKFKDENFKKAIIAQGVDTNKDGYIEFEEAEKVAYLAVVGREIKDVTGIGAFKNLISLQLRSNKLINLPKEIGKLTQLKYLRLKNNVLTSLPKEISNLTQLRNLDLAINRLTSLPKEIGALTQLTKFNLYQNRLTKLPNEVTQLVSLRHVYLNKNNELKLTIAHCRFFNGITNVSLPEGACAVLDNIVEIPDENFKKALIEKGVDTNNDGEIQFEEAEKVTSLLDVSNKEISDITGIGAFKNLTGLHMRNSQLTNVPKELFNLTELISLVLSYSKLKSLPAELVNLKKLLGLDLRDNPNLTLTTEQCTFIKSIRNHSLDSGICE